MILFGFDETENSDSLFKPAEDTFLNVMTFRKRHHDRNIRDITSVGTVDHSGPTTLAN